MTKIHMIGNAHLDPAWMWRIEEGMEAFIATCRSALDRIDETSEFLFTYSSAAHYDYLLRTDPVLFTRIQEAVHQHRWCLVGGWWVEPDCNLPCGESFVRQALYAQRFFREHFGKIATVGYCIDSFGHNANIPQLLRGAGMHDYVFMRPDQDEKYLEENLFRWIAPSGDEVLAYRIPLHYSNHMLQSKEKIARVEQFEKFDRHPWMLFYGVGNHGGGPTKLQIAEIQDASRNDDRIAFSDPEQFFSSVDADQPRYRGELQHHAIGCYSAHSEIKRLNRKVEHALLVAERMTVLGERLCNLPIRHDEFVTAWKNVCFNQFHDLLGGVAIEESMDDAVSMYREALSIAQRATRVAVQRIASAIDTHNEIETLIVFNPTAFHRTEFIEFELWHPDASERGMPLQSLIVTDREGNVVQVQFTEPSGLIGGDRVRFLLPVSVAALSYCSYRLERKVGAESYQMDALPHEVSQTTLESSLEYRSNPKVYADATDTWAHGKTQFTDYLDEFETIEIEQTEYGDIRECVRVKSVYHGSTLIENWYRSQGTDYFDVHVRLNWQEQRKLLKYRIHHGQKCPVASYEIPYAVLDRPIGPEEYPGQSWVFVSDEQNLNQGIGVITDSKYSYSVDSECINIVVARSPIYAHHSPPHEMFPDGIVRYQDQGEQEFHFRIILNAQNWQRARMPERSQCFLEPLIPHVESGHRGLLSAHPDLACSISNPCILLTVLKRCEDGNGYIVRLVQTEGIAARAIIALPLFGVLWEASFRPFEIKTFLLSESGVAEVDMIERLLEYE